MPSSCDPVNETLTVHKRHEIFWIAKRLFISGKGFCFTELVTSLLPIILCQLLHCIILSLSWRIMESSPMGSFHILLLRSEQKLKKANTIPGAITYLERSSTTTGLSEK